MADTAIPSAAATPDRRTALLLRLLGIWAVLVVGYLFLLPEQFADPFVRNDDYPALFGQPERFWWKTAAEGRWVNWLWTARPVIFDPTVLFAIYLGAWFWAWAAVAVAMTREQSTPVLALVLAAAFAVAPHGVIIHNWFNTLIPANLILAAVATVALFGSRRSAEWAMVLAIPPMLMCHSAYPFLLMAIVAVARRPESRLWGAVRLSLLFCASLAAALLAIFAINWLVHGHFSIVPSPFRQPNPIEGVEGLAENARRAFNALVQGVGRAFFNANDMLLVAYGAAAVALLSLPAEERGRRDRLLLAFAASLAVPFVHTLQSGMSWPPRAYATTWTVPVALVAIASVAAASRIRAVIFGALVLAAAVLGTAFWVLFWDLRAEPFQTESRAIAARIEAIAEPGDHLLVGGIVTGLESGVELQTAYGFEQRILLLTGVQPHLCVRQKNEFLIWQVITPEEAATAETSTDPFWVEALLSYRRCQPYLGQLAEMPVWPAEGAVARIGPGILALRLPDEPTERAVEVNRSRFSRVIRYPRKESSAAD